MSATSDQLLAYYSALPIVQYQGKPRFTATLSALLAGNDGAHGILANAVYNQVKDGFDLKTAVGKQLDFLGELIGPSRFFAALVLGETFMALPSYDDPLVGTYAGLATYETTPLPPDWFFMTYEDFVENTLVDSDYRRVLQFLASVQGSDYAYATLDAILFFWFGGNVNLKITGAMAITYQHLTSDTDNLFNILAQMGLLPAPAGVTVSVAQVASF